MIMIMIMMMMMMMATLTITIMIVITIIANNYTDSTDIFKIFSDHTLETSVKYKTILCRKCKHQIRLNIYFI